MLNVKVFFLVILICNVLAFDPYATLGISNSASENEIKKAYRKLAKKWHPDKSENPLATEKFMKIKHAYELLSDSSRKMNYDQWGTINDEPEQHQWPGDFANIFGARGFQFHAPLSFVNMRVNVHHFDDQLMPMSNRRPSLLLVYSDWCLVCHRLEPIWQTLVDDLKLLGYNFGTLDIGRDTDLASRVRVSTVPALVAVVDGRILHFRDSFSARSLLRFARHVLPSSSVLTIDQHAQLTRFLNVCSATNKASVLMLGNLDKPRLRYLLAAMKHGHFARFAYVQMADNSPIVDMKKALGISCAHCETLLVFNEFPMDGPVARVSSQNPLTPESIESLIEDNKHLLLPRLSSQDHLDSLCPVSPSRNGRKLCAILLATTLGDSDQVDTFRAYVQRKKAFDFIESIRFVYMFVDKQTAFVRAFPKSIVNDNDADVDGGRDNDVLVVWRVEERKARCSRLTKVWNGVRWKANGTAPDLDAQLSSILSGTTSLDTRLSLMPLVDELSPGWFGRLIRKTALAWDTLLFHIGREESLPVISAIGTVMFILVVGYALSYSVSVEEARQRKAAELRRPAQHSTPMGQGEVKMCRKSTTTSQHSRVQQDMKSIMHQLRAETYFGLVRLLKPGCRSIIILVDQNSKDMLLADFSRCLWPWRNNKTLSFGYLMVDKNLAWFGKLLEHTLPIDEGDPTSPATIMYQRLKHINPKQTVGTVLALCGWKLYFCIYHPMHTSYRDSHFLGFDDSDSSDMESLQSASKEEKTTLKTKQFKLEDVLVGLPNWLDRLFEGSINRYYVPEWPDNLK